MWIFLSNFTPDSKRIKVRIEIIMFNHSGDQSQPQSQPRDNSKVKAFDNERDLAHWNILLGGARSLVRVQ